MSQGTCLCVLTARSLAPTICAATASAGVQVGRAMTVSRHVPYTVQQVRMIICIHEEVVSYFTVQHGMAVLEVI